jgi:Fur family peroxide stress response transcriptional regulator
VRAKDKRARLERFEAACRERGLALTVQRRAILEAVLDRDDHPTADAVYGSVKGRIPGVSRTTVYRVLEALVRLGAITKVCHPGAVVRFDPKIQQHHHLVCLHCDRIVDVEDERLNQIAVPKIRAKGFELQEFHVHFRGICPECQKKEVAGTKKAAGAKGHVGRKKKVRKRSRSRKA